MEEEEEAERASVEAGLEEAEKHVSNDDSSVSWIRFEVILDSAEKKKRGT